MYYNTVLHSRDDANNTIWQKSLPWTWFDNKIVSMFSQRLQKKRFFISNVGETYTRRWGEIACEYDIKGRFTNMD